jgi:DNA recombination protein RmuC
MSGSIGGLGAALKNSVEKYNRAVASLESRVLPAARRFRELGISTRDAIVALEPVETIPRELTPSLPENGSLRDGN